MYYIPHSGFDAFLEKVHTDYEVYVPVKKGEQRFYRKYDRLTEDTVIGEVRAFEPLKSFFTPARELVAEDFLPTTPELCAKPLCIVGVKACDLKGFKVQDHVFTDHDYQDPFYLKFRKDNLIIAADCTCAIDTCFCLALGVQPHPQEDFDINLSDITDGFVVEAGSDKGEELLQKHKGFFQEATESMLSRRDEQRKSVAQAVRQNITDNAIPHEDSYAGMIMKKYDSDLWKEEAKTCVECGACNAICPTCHCFLLYDQKSDDRMARMRAWDSCMIKDFARVAGGANPREKLWMRLRNRFEKKFDFFPKVAGVYACTGCGRCISACPAKIDIRKVLHKLVTHV